MLLKYGHPNCWNNDRTHFFCYWNFWRFNFSHFCSFSRLSICRCFPSPRVEFKNFLNKWKFTFSNFQQWFDPTGNSADLFDDLYHLHRHLTLLLPDLNKIVDYRAEIKISKYRFLAISGFLELILMEHLEPKKYLRLSATNRN